MHRVRIKHPRPKELATKRRLLELLAPEVKVTQFIPTHDSVITVTASDKDTDAIFTEGCLTKLTEGGFQPVMPPELKTRRSVVCFRLDELIYDNTPEEIKTEVERTQSWVKVQDVYKFPNARTVKLTFTTSDMARKARDSGLLMFAMSVPPLTKSGRRSVPH